jgi:F420-0:gamma-glutamyl ligase-like protein
MCPICITTTALVAAGATSGVGVLGFLAGNVRTLGRRWRALKGSWRAPVSRSTPCESNMQSLQCRHLDATKLRDCATHSQAWAHSSARQPR